MARIRSAALGLARAGEDVERGGADRARDQLVDRDAVVAQLRREHAHQRGHARFRGRVGAEAARVGAARARAQHDDRAAARGAECGDGGLGGDPHSGEVDVDDRVPLLEREVERRRHLRGDPRVRDDDVEPSEAVDGRVGGALHRVEVGHVGGNREPRGRRRR